MRRGSLAVIVLAAALLAGCGGGSPTAPALPSVASVNAQSRAPTVPPAGGFSKLYVFGDSLSDNGAYTLAAVSRYGLTTPFTGLAYPAGGQFTVNGAVTGNWTQMVAGALGLGLTPNVVGFAVGGVPAYLQASGAITPDENQARCAFDAAAAGAGPTCTNYAQGGSMVTNPAGPGHDRGLLTIPVEQQVNNALAQFGSFDANALILVLAGNNDVLRALENVKSDVEQAVAQARAQNPGMTPAQVQQVQQQAQAQAAAKAQAAVGLAADQLAGVVTQNILGRGGRYVVVYTLPDAARTPFGQSLAGGATCDITDTTQPCYLLSNLVQVFNQRLLGNLQGAPVKMIDGFALLNEEMANPARFGLTNVSTPWCDPATQTSLLCNVRTPNAAAGASLANLNGWLYADGLHPAPAGHKIIYDFTLAALRTIGWFRQ